MCRHPLFYVLPLIGLFMSGSVLAQFNFCAGSNSGSFEFEPIEQSDAIIAGEIPIGVDGLALNLKSISDLDFQLYDKMSNTQIVHWPHGVLSGAFQGSAEYLGLTYEYSGYNGACPETNPPPGCGAGNEYIKISGTTNRTLVVKVFGFQPGSGTIEYTWTGQAECNGGDPFSGGVVPPPPAGKTFSGFNGVWIAGSLGQVITVYDGEQLSLTVLGTNRMYFAFSGPLSISTDCLQSPCPPQYSADLQPQVPQDPTGKAFIDLHSADNASLTVCTATLGCSDQPVTLTRIF